MNDQELFDLCREVCEKTGWKDTPEYIEQRFVQGELYATEVTENAGYEDDDTIFGKVQRLHTPLYTSDYLLKKLKRKNGLAVHIWSTGLWSAECEKPRVEFQEWVDYWQGEADTPLKALLKLTLALHEAGELK